MQKGNIGVTTENIFPIIKKFLYSDHEIFLRELVSNAVDATQKLKTLASKGEFKGEMGDLTIKVSLGKDTITISDRGIGLTAEEIDKYINQIAFSGANDFLEKYKDKTTEDDMIGHFGLGFYSAFMVADEVTIDTLSYKEGAEPVHWTCDGDTEYTMATGTKETVGTEITLFLNEESTEFANEYRAREIIEKYCSFMPTEIFLSVEGAEQEFETIPEDQVKDDDVVVEHDGAQRDEPPAHQLVAVQQKPGKALVLGVQVDQIVIRRGIAQGDLRPEVEVSKKLYIKTSIRKSAMGANSIASTPMTQHISISERPRFIYP